MASSCHAPARGSSGRGADELTQFTPLVRPWPKPWHVAQSRGRATLSIALVHGAMGVVTIEAVLANRQMLEQERTALWHRRWHR